MEIIKRYNKTLPSEYLTFLKDKPEGEEIAFNEYEDAEADDEGRFWNIMGATELLENLEMNDVGKAMNFECLKLYVQVQREFSEGDWTESNVGNIELTRVESGFVIGEENGDYLYLDPADNFSVWIYYHDGGDVLKVADSFKGFLGKDFLGS